MAASSLFLRSPPSMFNPKSISISSPRIQILPHSVRPPLPVVSLSTCPNGNIFIPVARAAESDGANVVEAEKEEREVETGESTMPERFRVLSKEAPEKMPPRWTWLLAVVILVYPWRTIMWELSNWKKAAIAIANFVGYIGKLILAFVFHFIGTPVTASIQFFEFVIGFTYSIYSSIVAFTPVRELTNIILLTSAVLAVAESVTPNTVNNQLYLLAAAGLAGYGIINGHLLGVFFVLLLVCSFCFSKFVKKEDALAAALPSAALLVAIGEPWLRAVVMIGYLALAIFHHSRSSPNHAEDGMPPRSRIRPPVPLLIAALSIGIHLGAKWIRQRHLTWMIA